MVSKEIRTMIKNPVYIIMIILPFALTFFMSEGTKDYLLNQSIEGDIVSTAKEIVLYKGEKLTAQIQFATSELSFILMMISILIGINVFEERNHHIWDRIVNKGKFLFVKFILHFIYSLIIIAISITAFSMVYDIKMPTISIILFCTIPIISLTFGILIALIASSRAVLSNTILMIVMLLGYFGGALSLTSVLANTAIMKNLMYISPLTVVNKLIFKQILDIFRPIELLPWIIIVFTILILSLIVIRRRVKYGSII